MQGIDFQRYETRRFVNIMRRAIYKTLVLVLLITMITGCASSYYRGDRYGTAADLASQADEDQDGVSSPTYFGYGAGKDPDAAEQAALKDAVRRSVYDALGDAAVIVQGQVEQVFREIRTVDSFILDFSRRIIDKDHRDGIYETIVSVRVDIAEIATYLLARGISGGRIVPGKGLLLPDMVLPSYGSALPLSQVLPAAGYAWEGGWTPVFMVYFDQNRSTDAFMSDLVVSAAGDTLSEKGFPYVDTKRIEEIKQEQDAVFTDEQGYASMLRWVASQVHADYYIDAAVQYSVRQQGSGYTAEATVTLDCFDASTASGRGSVVVGSPSPARGSTRQGAIEMAVVESVKVAMDRLLQKVSGYFVSDAEKGVTYDLIVMRTLDDKMMREFVKALEPSVISVRRVSFSLEESRYTILFDGSQDQLEDAIYAAAERVQGLERFFLVYQRGKSLTFDTGR